MQFPVYPAMENKNSRKRVRRDTTSVRDVNEKKKKKKNKKRKKEKKKLVAAISKLIGGWLIARIRISLLWVVQRYGAVGGIVQPLRCETARSSAVRPSAIPVSSRGATTFATRWPELRRYSVLSYLL